MQFGALQSLDLGKEYVRQDPYSVYHVYGNQKQIEGKFSSFLDDFKDESETATITNATVLINSCLESYTKVTINLINYLHDADQIT